jgi:hypothetical protein
MKTLIILVLVLTFSYSSQPDGNEIEAESIVAKVRPKKTKLTNIEGTYSISSSTLESDITDNVEVTFQSDRIALKGCNINSNGYKISKSGEFSLSGKSWMTTMMFCLVDHDK